MEQWRIQNGSVILDTFNDKPKSKVPPNRHRIPAVGDQNLGRKETKRIGDSPDGGFIWDMDGRRHKKPKSKPKRVITSNASLHKVDLPRIKPGEPTVLSPGNNYSQPAGIGKLPNTTIAPNKSGKFVNPGDKRIRRPRDPPIDLNTQSHNGLSLVDINIPNAADPTAPIHEPPIEDYPSNETPHPDYVCPVCKERVKGRDTAKHSRRCRTTACRFCQVEQEIALLDRHEAECPHRPPNDRDSVPG